MLEGPVELCMSDKVGTILVYRKMYGDHDSYLTVGSEYASEHPDDVAEDVLEEMMDKSQGTGQKWDESVKQMFRELFEFMGVPNVDVDE